MAPLMNVGEKQYHFSMVIYCANDSYTELTHWPLGHLEEYLDE